MRGFVTLQRRLAKLEGKRTGPRFPRVVWQLYDVEPETIIGFENGFGAVTRLEGESVAECEARAFAELGDGILSAIYPPEPPQDASAAKVGHTPADAHKGAPASPVGKPDDPYARAGIGVRASRDQLIRMGAIAVPPERLV